MVTTFHQIWREVQQGTNNTSPSELILIKRDANTATGRFKSVMTRPWSRISRKCDIVADQRDYQLPRSVLRPSGVSYLYGDQYYPLVEISSEENWNRLIAVPNITIGIPKFYFPKGKNVISIHPMPGSALEEGLKVYYEPKQPRMVADDITGAFTVTNGDDTITGTGFTEAMIGRYFYVTDGTDGYDYQIVEYGSATQLSLENYFEGISGSVAGLIGVVPDIPDEYIPAIVDYCYARFYYRRGDTTKGDSFMGMFERAIEECKEAYASPTSYPNIHNPYGATMHYLDVPPISLT